jgi:hypothetical protein
MKRIQITKAYQLDDLDSDEIVEGYRDGAAGEPEPGGNRSYAFWHGWTKGALDGGYRETTDADILLCRDIVKNRPDLWPRAGGLEDE